MATVIDSLLVELGFDGSKFAAGTKSVSNDLKKTRNEASLTGKELELSAKNAAQGFMKLRNEVLGLFALMTAGRGIKAMTSEITNSDAALGRFAKNVNLSATEIAAWEGAVRHVGGTAAGADAGIQSMTQAFQELALTGKSDVVPYLIALKVKISDDVTGKMRPLADIFQDLNKSAQGRDPAQANYLLAGLHLDQGMINLLMQTPDALNKLLEAQRKLAPTPEDTARAQKLTDAWLDFQSVMMQISRTILNAVSPALETFFKGLGDWLQSINWKQFGDDVSSALATAMTFLKAQSWESIKTGIELVLGALVGAKMLGAIANLVALGSALAAIGRLLRLAPAAPVLPAAEAGAGAVAGAATGGVLGWAIRMFPALAALLTIGPAGGEDPEFSKAKNDEYRRNNPPGSHSFGDWLHSILPPSLGGAPLPPGTNPNAPNGVPRTGPIFGPQTPGGPADAVSRRLQELGWSPEQAAGITANIQRESSFNPREVGDGGQAYGLAQWHPDRQAAFAAWKGYDIRQSSFQDQVDFINHELTEGAEKSAGARLKAAKTAAEAGSIVSQYYERPRDRDGEASARASLAERYRAGWTAQPGAPGKPLRLAGIPYIGAGSFLGARFLGPQGRVHTSSSSTTVGQVTIHTAATDAKGIAGDLRKRLMEYNYVPQMNTGLS
jgi:hypothetical protein